MSIFPRGYTRKKKIMMLRYRIKGWFKSPPYAFKDYPVYIIEKDGMFEGELLGFKIIIPGYQTRDECLSDFKRIIEEEWSEEDRHSYKPGKHYRKIMYTPATDYETRSFMDS